MHPEDQASDIALLQAYGRNGDEAAFDALVRRYVDLVFAVSLRRSNNRSLAEEATQNVLLSLSRKARKLAIQEKNLAGWLHRSARFEVGRLQRREARLKKREQTYASQNMKTGEETDHEEYCHLYPVLDEVIDQLRTADREVIVRRYLGGESFRRIGDALGISEDAAQKRTSRAFEKLNRIFKRKVGAGVPVSAILIALSRESVEAAPAACLPVASAASTTGLASLLSSTTLTLTTMHLTKTTSIAAGLLLLGGTAAFVTTRYGSAPESSLADSTKKGTSIPGLSDRQAPHPSQRAKEREQAGLPSPTSDEQDQFTAMNPHPGKEEFTRRLSVKHERWLADLIEELNLSPGQTGNLKAILDRRLTAFRATLDEGPGEKDSEQESFRKEGDMVAKAGRLIRGGGLRDELKDILDEEQLAAFDQKKAKEEQAQIESHALVELSKISPILGLSEEQKDRTFGLLQQSSAATLQADQDQRAFLALQKNQTPTSMDLTDPGDLNLLEEIFGGGSDLTPDSPAFRERLVEEVGSRINESVSRLAPVLDEAQQERYRDYLVQGSLLGNFGIKLSTQPQE